jgi:hypothetical protein
MEGWKDAGRDALTDIANALALRGEGASRPLPEHLSTLPALTEKIKAKREVKFQAALRALRKVRGGWRAREGDDDDGDGDDDEEEEETRAKAKAKEKKGGGDGDAAFVAALTEVDAVVDALRALLDGEDDALDALLDGEDAARTTRGKKTTTTTTRDEDDDPPFGGASASTLLEMLERATEAYREDYFVKRETLDAVLDAAASAGRGSEGRGGPGEVWEKSRRDGGRTDDEGGEARDREDEDSKHLVDLSHETLTTLVATWILSPAIDDDAVDEFAAVAARETSAA